MALKTHHYSVNVAWVGNLGTGTFSYAAYGRDYEITHGGKPVLLGSSDPSFRGDPNRWNPEELLVGSLSACHKLWYLHLCSTNGIAVLEYQDSATGEMAEEESGRGRFLSVTLHPQVMIADGQNRELALALHEEAHQYCFIANSVSFEVKHHASVRSHSTRHEDSVNSPGEHK